ncbi:MAG: hypothetical protein QF473_40485, partial [Planctomycetota bacterium]|nr:hypothetical protein [Planctomycetota bacterium]
GVVAGQHVNHPVGEDVGIVDRANHSRVHIVRGVDTVPPFARVACRSPSPQICPSSLFEVYCCGGPSPCG